MKSVTVFRICVNDGWTKYPTRHFYKTIARKKIPERGMLQVEKASLIFWKS